LVASLSAAGALSVLVGGDVALDAEGEEPALEPDAEEPVVVSDVDLSWAPPEGGDEGAGELDGDVEGEAGAEADDPVADDPDEGEDAGDPDDEVDGDVDGEAEGACPPPERAPGWSLPDSVHPAAAMVTSASAHAPASKSFIMVVYSLLPSIPPMLDAMPPAFEPSPPETSESICPDSGAGARSFRKPTTVSTAARALSSGMPVRSTTMLISVFIDVPPGVLRGSSDCRPGSAVLTQATRVPARPRPHVTALRDR
jgi:hypothetical protein